MELLDSGISISTLKKIKRRHRSSWERFSPVILGGFCDEFEGDKGVKVIQIRNARWFARFMSIGEGLP